MTKPRRLVQKHNYQIRSYGPRRWDWVCSCGEKSKPNLNYPSGTRASVAAAKHKREAEKG